MALKDALSKLNTAITDLSSLHVRTYTGTLTLEPGVKIDLAKVAAEIKKKDSNLTGGKYTTYRAVAERAVEAGIKTRQGLLELVTGWFD